jgi:hypothetical protein
MMQPRIGHAVTAKVFDRVTGPTGINSSLAALTHSERALAAPLDETQVRTQNVALDLVERGGTVKYPAVHLYCEKIANTLVEKFRTFSGNVLMAIEIRHSHDRLEGLQDRLELYADAMAQVLHTNRGDWGDGMFYGGAYELSFGAVKHGGKNFLQVAKITFQIGVSKS